MKNNFSISLQTVWLILLGCCITPTVFSQNLLTNGSFGDFNAGVQQPPKIGYESNYNQINYSNGISIPRQYAITNEASTVNNSNFIALKDHTTGNGTGNMMVVDGDANEIFWKKYSISLLSGNTYTFSFFIHNIVKNNSDPKAIVNVKFVNCSNCTDQQINLNTLDPNTWHKQTFTITPNTNINLAIELSTVNAGPVGNDFAIDDLSLYGPPLPLEISSSQTNPSCTTTNDGVIVAYGAGGIQPYTYTLSGGATTVPPNTTGIFQGLAAGTYTVQITDSDSSPKTVNSGSIELKSPSPITITANKTGCILPSTAVTLTATGGGASYTWTASPGPNLTSTTNTITVTPSTTTTYTASSTINSTLAPSNLITNGDFENLNKGFSSDYGYYPTGNPAGAQIAYGITKNPSSWFVDFKNYVDHTSGNGNMLVCDGAIDGTSVVWSQTVSVNPNTDYDFSFWAQNLTHIGTNATYKVQINGVDLILKNYDGTQIINSATNNGTTKVGWTELKATWNSSASSIATIKIIDTNNSIAGNDFALDDIDFKAKTSINKSCPLSTPYTVTIGTLSATGFNYTTPVCKNGTNPSPIKVPGFTTGGSFSSTTGLTINPTTGEINLATSTPGSYTVTYTFAANASLCIAAGSSTAPIVINAVPSISTTTPNSICGAGTVTLQATASSGTINWYTAASGGSAIATGGSFTTPSINTTTTYYVDATANGCTTSSRTPIVATVHPLPTAPVAVASAHPTCASANTGIITVTTVAGLTYSIDGSDYSNTSGIFSGLTSGNYSVTAKNATGCISPATLIGINNQPITPVLVITNPSPVCSPTVIDLTDASITAGSTGSGTLTYWNDLAATSPLLTPTSVTVSGTYYIKSTVNGICSDTKPVVVVIRPTETISISCGTSAMDSVSFNWNSITDCTGFTYTTTVNGLSGPSGTLPSSATNLTIPSLSPGDAVILTLNPSGSNCVQAVTSAPCFTLVCPLPTVDPIPNSVVCSGDTVTLQAFTSTPVNPSTTFSWTITNNIGSPSLSGTGSLPLFVTSNTTNSPITATITVRATQGACTGPATTYTITVQPKPVITVSSPAAVCAPATVDITTAFTVTGGGTISYWNDPSTSIPLTNPNSIATSGTYYIKSTVGSSTTCTEIKPVIVTVRPTEVITITCGSTTLNSVTFNWNTITDSTGFSYSSTVNGLAGPSGTLAATATTLTIPGLLPNDAVQLTLTPTGSNCVQPALSGICNALPCNNPIVSPMANLIVCSGAIIPQQTFSSTPVDLINTKYYWSMTNSIGAPALSGIGNIPSFTALNNTNSAITATVQVYAEQLGPCTGSIMTYTITVQPQPIITVTTPAAVCAPATVDITTAFAATGGGTISYWNDTTASIPLTNPNAIATSGTYYIKSTVAGLCSVIEQVNVTIRPTETLVINCGTATYNSVDFEWNSISDATGFTYTTTVNGTPGPFGNLTNTATSVTITPLNQGDSVILTLTPTGSNCVAAVTSAPCTALTCVAPIVTPLADVNVCAGEAVPTQIFNSTSTDPSTIFNWTMSTSVGTLLSGTGNIPSFTSVNTTNLPITTIVSVQAISTGCPSPTMTYKIRVTPQTSLTIITPAAACAPDTVDITNAFTSTGGGVISFWEDAAASLPLLAPNSISVSGTYFIKSTNGTCYDIQPVSVIVNPSITPILTKGTICIDATSRNVIRDYTLDTRLSHPDYTYKWYLDGVILPSENNSTLVAQKGGTYSVIVTNTSTGCQSEEITVNVIQSEPANASYTLTKSFSDEQTFTVNVKNGNESDYTYQLDSESIQTSPIFYSVTPGPHTITIRDIEGCQDTVIDAYALDFPNFFTPNNDGSNDTWNITELAPQPNAVIYIFDRFGKLLEEIRPNGAGWDGTYNRKDLPATDYWFKVIFEENGKTIEFNSHFSLLR